MDQDNSKNILNIKYKEIKYKNVKRNMYYISEFGDIYSTYSKRLLKPKKDKDGYLTIGLQNNDSSRSFHRISTLTAITFIGMPPSYLNDATVDHINGDITLNNYTNLRWVERSLNSSIRKVKPKGELNGSHVLSEVEVLDICKLIIENKITLTDIGIMYGVGKSAISNIKRGKTWAHITKDFNFVIKNQKK